MFEHFRRYPWVLEPYLYENQDGLLATLGSRVIGPAWRPLSPHISRFHRIVLRGGDRGTNDPDRT
jgi:hypothetical protein